MSRIDLTPEATTSTGVRDKRGQVGGLVEAVRGVAVHATEAARRHDVDAHAMGDGDGARDGGRAVGAERQRQAQVAGRQLRRVASRVDASSSSSSRVSPTTTLPSSTPMVAGTDPPSSHRLLALARDLEVDRRGQTLDDNGRLEGDDAAAFVERGRDFVARARRGSSKELFTQSEVYCYGREFA